MDAVHVLKNINTRSRSLLDQLHPLDSQPRVQPLPPSKVSSVYAIPNPPSITPYLTRIGWKHRAAELLSMAYMQHATQLKTQYEINMAKAINACAHAGPSIDVREQVMAILVAYQSTYRRALRQWLDTSMRLSTQRIADLKASEGLVKGGVDNTIEKRSPFKTEVSSLLEEIFLREQYPSRADKLTLAQRTGMKLKQIHIWNRRTRSRRDGPEFKKFSYVREGSSSSTTRDSTRGPTRTALASSEPFLILPSTTHHDRLTAQTRCPFDIVAAPHAFPGPYPPVCDYDPFPGAGHSYEVQWPRHSSRPRPIDKQSFADADALVVLMSCLSLDDTEDTSSVASSTSPANRSKFNHCVSIAASCYPFLVTPPFAPLPALECADIATRVANDTAHNSSSSSPDYRHLAARNPVTLKSNFTPSRKSESSSLLRTPISTPRSLRDSSHPYHTSSHLRRHSKLARLTSTSSMSSIYSDGSSVSLESTPSSVVSPLLTPPQPPVALQAPSKLFMSPLMLGPLPDLNCTLGSLPQSTSGAYDSSGGYFWPSDD